MEQTKYSIVVETLRKEILGGKWSSGHASFPSERALVRRFGVSRPTVSQALQELRGQGYLLRQQGRGTFLTRTAQKISGAIGLIVPGNCYAEIFPPICHEISRLAQERGMSVVLGDVSSSSAETRARQVVSIARRFAADRVAGIIYQPTELVAKVEDLNRDALKILDDAKVPVVVIDWDVVPSPLRSAYDLVGIDNFDAGRLLARHMVERGAKQLRFLIKPNSAYSIRKRVLGAKSCVPYADKVEVTIDVSSKEDVSKLLKRRPRPDALICGNDTMAAHLLVTLRKLGVKVPDEVMVAGFDDVQHASLVVPSLTTIHQPCVEIARKAVDVLLTRIVNPTASVCAYYLPAPLVVRESTSRKDFSEKKQVKKGKGKC